jgi:predicted phage baseplate assembly protein
VRIDVVEPAGQSTWRRCEALAAQGPLDAVYEFDAAAERVTFGNGLNGRAPSIGSQVLAWYAVCDGAQGKVARNRRWRVQGFGEVFGTNPDAITGGAGAIDWRAQRRDARRQVREDHALVSADDIAHAALALPLLDVARAWIVPPDDACPGTGTITLVAMRGLRAGEEGMPMPETPRWLDAIRQRLLPRMPLGTRLAVIGPRYVPFTVRATLEVAAGRDIDDVGRDAMAALAVRLATTGPFARTPGVPVSRNDLAGWLRAVDGVVRLVSLQLFDGAGDDVDNVAVSHRGLPRLDAANSRIDVQRPGRGGAR